MSSYLDMSLDDIIKKKREETRAKRRKVRPEPFKTVFKMAPIMDARYEILSKKRTFITREKLTQLAKRKDAHFKLEQLRQERGTVPGPVRNTSPNRGIFTRAPPATEIVFADSSRQVTLQPLATEFQHKPLLQAAVQSDLQIIDDSHMEEEYVPQPLSMLNRKPSIQVKIRPAGFLEVQTQLK